LRSPACPLGLCVSLAALVALSACSSPPAASGNEGGSSQGGSSGDGSAPEASGGSVNLEVWPLMYVSPELPVELLEDGDPIELWHATQGGHVLLVGARVRGLEGPYVKLAVLLRNPEDSTIYKQGSETVNMQPVPGEPDLMETDRRTRSQVIHLGVCPDYDARDIVGQPWRLEVEVTELYADRPATGSAVGTVVPTCMQTVATEQAFCECECSAGYTLGKCVP
jgi:hypothetical protein